MIQILKDFTLQSSRKEYSCDICNKTIECGTLYRRYYRQGSSSADVCHTKCYNKQLKQEFKQLMKESEKEESK